MPSDKSKRVLHQLAREGEKPDAERLSKAGFGERVEMQDSLDELEHTGRITKRDDDYEVNNDKTED